MLTNKAITFLLQNTFVIIFKDDEEGYHAPKALGDIFESLAGAIFIDTNLNLVEVWKVFYPMIKHLIGM